MGILILILKTLTCLALAVLPLAVLIRDWKFSDKRTKLHHKITRCIVLVWFAASLCAVAFVWLETYRSSQLDAKVSELVDGKNELLAKIDAYQSDLTQKEQEIEELKEKAKKAERGISEYFLPSGTIRRTHGGNITVDNTLVNVFNKMKELEEQNSYPDLRNICQDQIRENPKWPTPYLFLGVALGNLGHSDQAIKELEHFLEIAPTESAYGYVDYRTQAQTFIVLLRNNKLIQTDTIVGSPEAHDDN